MQLRTIVLNDYKKLFDFWEKNYSVSEMDNLEHFETFLNKNSDLSVLIEEDGEIIGTTLGSYDGRRGYLQKVVVSKEYRKHGIGVKLVNEVVKRLRNAGAVYIPISVEKELIVFYQRAGFVKKDTTSMIFDL